MFPYFFKIDFEEICHTLTVVLRGDETTAALTPVAFKAVEIRPVRDPVLLYFVWL